MEGFPFATPVPTKIFSRFASPAPAHSPRPTTGASTSAPASASSSASSSSYDVPYSSQQLPWEALNELSAVSYSNPRVSRDDEVNGDEHLNYSTRSGGTPAKRSDELFSRMTAAAATHPVHKGKENSGYVDGIDEAPDLKWMDGRVVERLNEELASVRRDLVSAVEGWRTDRNDFHKQMKAAAEHQKAQLVNNTVSAIKTELVTEKRRMRGMIAQLQTRNKELESILESSTASYEEKLLKQRADLLAAETGKNQQRQISRRMSVELSQVAETEQNLSQALSECNARHSAEVGDLRQAITKLLAANGSKDDKIREAEATTGSLTRKNADLEKEIERLKNMLADRVNKPTRKPPTPPVEFDFLKFSDTKIDTVQSKEGTTQFVIKKQHEKPHSGGGA